MQINWTLVAGLAAFSLAAAANWDAGTAAGHRRRPWRALSVVYLLLLGDLILESRFGLVDAIRGALPGIGRHAARIGVALLMAAAATGAVIGIARAAGRAPLFLPAGLVALAAASLFGVEALSSGAAGALLYRPAGPVMLIAWAWLACGAAAVGIAVLATVRSSPARGGGRPQV